MINRAFYYNTRRYNTYANISRDESEPARARAACYIQYIIIIQQPRVEFSLWTDTFRGGFRKANGRTGESVILLFARGKRRRRGGAQW